MIEHVPEANEIGSLELAIDGEDTYRTWDVEGEQFGFVTEMVTLAPSFTGEPEPVIVFRIVANDGLVSHAQITLSVFLQAAHVIRSSYGLSF